MRNRYPTRPSVGSHAARQGATRCAATVQRCEKGVKNTQLSFSHPLFHPPPVRSVGTDLCHFSHRMHGSPRAKLPTKLGVKTMGRKLPLFYTVLVPRPGCARSRTGRSAGAQGCSLHGRRRTYRVLHRAAEEAYRRVEDGPEGIAHWAAQHGNSTEEGEQKHSGTSPVPDYMIETEQLTRFTYPCGRIADSMKCDLSDH